MPKRRDGWVGADPLVGDKGGYSRGAEFDDPSWEGTYEWDPTDIPGSIDDWTEQYGAAPSSSADAYRQFLGDAGGDWAAKEGECNARGGGWRWVPNADGTGSCHRPDDWNDPDPEPQPQIQPFAADTTSGDIATDITLPYTGEIPEDVTTTDYPYTTPQMQTIGNIQVGDDPISEIANAATGTMMLSGGMPQTPFNQGTMDALAAVIGGGGGGGAAETPFGGQIQDELSNIMANRGYLEPDPQQQAMEFEQLRTPIDAMRRAQLAQGQATMADRNILGSGAEVDFLERLESSLAPAYSAAGQQLALSRMEEADTRYMAALAQGQSMAQAQADRRESRLLPALSLATGMAEQSASNMLNSVQTWTDRQAMLADVAMRNLDQNVNWSQFLANYGLQRDQILEMVRTGRLDALAQALNNNLAGLQTISQGFVPYGDQ